MPGNTECGKPAMRIRKSVTLALLLPLAMGAVVVAARLTPRDGETPQQNDAPTATQIEALVARVIANQHKNDQNLSEYEHREHEVDRNSRDAKNGPTETTSQVVPTGAGTTRIVLERNGKPTDPMILEQQWQDVARALALHNDLNDERTRQDREKAEHRRRERTDMEDAIGKAFRFRWIGRESDGNHTIIELAFEPEPDFRSTVRFANVYAHVRGTVWLDEASSQVVKLEAQLNDDVSFYGVLARVYRGGKFVTEQVEVAPDVWLPSRVAFDFEGRKLVFPEAIHEHVEMSQYRRIGPPEAALEVIRREHLNIAANSP
jgi:hypothetical protein